MPITYPGNFHPRFGIFRTHRSANFCPGRRHWFTTAELAPALRRWRQRAGKLITPFAHDQFDNAYRLKRLGVAKVIDADRYNANAATPLLGSLLTDKSVRNNCREMATRIQNSDPISRTCELIEDLALMQQISS